MRESTMVQAWLQEGREEGREETTLELARNMLAIGITLEQVAAVTGLSIEQIKTLTAG